MDILNRKNFFTVLFVLVLSLFAGVYAVFAQSAGLVSRWNGDEVSRTSAGVLDVSDIEGDNNGILYDTHDTTPGNIGNAFNLSGGNEYIRIGNPANLNFGTGPFSLEAWFNWNGGGSSKGNIIRKSNYPVSGDGAGYWLVIGKDKRILEFFVGETVGNEGKSRGSVSVPISSRAWHHVVATRDNSGIMKLYVDGELKCTAKAPNANTTSEAPFTIGGWVDRFGATEFFSGLIGEISVYNTALDSSEVESLYSDIEEDLELYRTIEPYIKRGETPGQCTTVRGCRAYCDLEENFDECFDFAVKAGLIEIEDSYLLALQNGEAPGGCIGEDACVEYCGEASHIKECVAFFAKFDVFPPDVLQILYDLIAACEREPDFKTCIESGTGEPDQPVDPGTGIQVGVNASQAVQKVQDAMQKGESPGQCKDEVACRKYCENIDNIKECSDFADKFDLVSPDELKEMRQIADAKKAGVSFPGNCKTKESCLKYCDNSANAVVCMEFALKAGFIPKEDIEAVGKILPYLKSGGKLPGGCTTKESCDVYCESDTHTSECVDFAVKAGFMTKEEADIVKKAGGKGPGNCRSREACDNYCKDEKHIDECVDFAVRAGLISQEDAEQAKKYKITSGPGGCKNKADCEAFCVVNQDVCFQFAKDHGMLSEEDLKNIEEQKKFLGSLDKAPPEWLACMEKELGSEFFGRFKAGKITQSEAKSPALETAQRKCESEAGQDIRKEIEACLNKATCAEFNSCFDALPKCNQQQGGQQSSGQGQQQGPQDETGKKVEARARACLNEKMDACLGLSCSEFEACTKSLQQSGGQQGGQQGAGGQGQQQGQGENVKFNAKMKVCQDEIKAIKMKEIQAKMTACLSRSCSEFDACLKSVQQSQGGEQQDGQQSSQPQDQSAPDPAITAKAQSCQQEKVNACLAKPCGEFQACLNSLGGGGGGEQQQQQQGTPDPAVQSKFMTCFPPPPSGGGPPQSLLREHSFLAVVLNFFFGH